MSGFREVIYNLYETRETTLRHFLLLQRSSKIIDRKIFVWKTFCGKMTIIVGKKKLTNRNFLLMGAIPSLFRQVFCN